VLHLRTSASSAALTRAIEDQVHSIEPDLPVFDVMTMHDALQGGNGFMLMRLAAQFAGALGGLGLLLAVVGVYGVISYAGNQRIHEIGIRMALGAQRGAILRLVVRDVAGLVLIGAVAGAAIAWGTTRFVQSLLFGLQADDPRTFAVGIGLLIVVAIVACYLPARRAMRVDPLVALRHE
jgi:ABC-type antimicrobial peptide transport system permease subunit